MPDTGVYAFSANAITGYNSGSEYAFDTKFDVSPVAGAVPEPATWALMILGMGAVGFAMRRRSKINTTVRFA